MKIILTFEDIKKLILDSYNGVNDVSIKDESIEFLLDVEGDKFHRLTNDNRVELEQQPNNISIPITNPQQTKRIHKLGEEIDFDALALEKPIVETSSIPPKEKTLEERNEEAMSKGLMTSGRGASRVVKKF